MVALLAALWLLTLYPIALGPALGSISIVAVMLGAVTPDIDQPTANVWRRFLGGRAVGNIFQWFSGGHRHMTHSILGMIVIGFLLNWIIQHIIALDYRAPGMVIWYAYMIGYISHSAADTLTDRGVPWLWPMKINFKVPPGPEEVRVTTDSFVETFLVRGAILVAALFLISQHWPLLIRFFFGAG
jgi:inner membrane protein